MLTEIKDYLQNKQIASLNEIAAHIGVDAEVARQMLQFWINKGQVIPYQPQNSCGSHCYQCNWSQEEYYAWRAAKPPSCTIDPP